MTGVHVLTARAVDGVSQTTTSSAVSITVLPALAATYDSGLKVPRCLSLGVSCNSGSSLLLGRGTVGPELHRPNTINATCADQSSGTFHASESIDAVSVTSVAGLRPGASVQVNATIWATSSTDRLDLYRASNASSPTWVLIGTLTPTMLNQASTLSATFTLPTGATQAVRASLRKGGSVGTCPSGSFNDRDDLVFATQ